MEMEKNGNVRHLFGTAGNVEAAETLFGRAMRFDQNRATFVEAERLYREVVRLNPRHWEAWNNLGVMAYELGHKDEALEMWARALEENEYAADVYNNLGSVFSNENRLELASSYLARALTLDDELGEARVNLGFVLQRLGRPRAALRHFRHYLRRWPEGDNAEFVRKQEALIRQAGCR